MAITPAPHQTSDSDGLAYDAGEKEMHQQIEHANTSMTPMDNGEDGKLTKETILAYIAMCGQINAYIMSMLIPATTLSYINAELGPDPNSTWITLNWTFGASMIVSIGGRLSDIFGRRYFMMTGALISICGCLVGANGRSINQMIASGALFGIGSGFQELCYACVQEAVPNRYRVMAVGGLDVSLALAFSSPLVSYAFIAHQDIGWRGAYWYLFSFHCFAFLMLFFFYNPPDFEMKHREDGETKWQLVKQMDWVGVFLFLSGGALFLIGVNFGGRTYPWTHPGTFDMVIVVCFVGGMLYYSMNVLWPRQSQAFFVPEGDIIMRGVYATIFSCGTWTAGLVVVFICSRLHHEKWQLVTFTIVQTALIGSMASVGANDEAQAIVTVVLAATTITPPQLLSFTMLSFGLEDQRDLGVAVGLAGTFRLFGGAVATAIYTAIYTNRFNEVLPGQLTAAIQASDVEFSEGLLQSMIKAATLNTRTAYEAVSGATPDLVDRVIEGARESYVQGFSLVYLVAIAFGVCATIAAACTVSTDRSKKNNDRAVVMKDEVLKRDAMLQKKTVA
ncbi:Trichothecene efflux pump TRI12 like protein [Verticillium longisporum]|uniref:Trichothecene efflux pump TRI12 like protein n=1 Tax=Verticillium longisporum TaxID=100787 RepID=A0A8I3A0P0_VERLO|nr:Trichothecene efflux pump TRI12 like protein [Verticillium longisporum]